MNNNIRPIETIEIKTCAKCFFLEHTTDGKITVYRCKIDKNQPLTIKDIIKNSDSLLDCINNEMKLDTCFFNHNMLVIK